MKHTNNKKEITAEQKKQIEEIISRSECPKDFKCYKSDFSEVCKASNIGLGGFVECLEQNGNLCNFSMPFGKSYLCTCPLRIYISKELNI